MQHKNQLERNAFSDIIMTLQDNYNDETKSLPAGNSLKQYSGKKDKWNPWEF